MEISEVGISWDGYYPYCKKCGYFDLKDKEEKCPRCGVIQDWSRIYKNMENMKIKEINNGSY